MDSIFFAYIDGNAWFLVFLWGEYMFVLPYFGLLFVNSSFFFFINNDGCEF